VDDYYALLGIAHSAGHGELRRAWRRLALQWHPDRACGDIIELFLNPDGAATGGMVTIPMRVPVRCQSCATAPSAPCDRCGGRRTVDDLFTAWLAVPAGVQDGEILPPSALLPGMINRVLFRVRLAGH